MTALSPRDHIAIEAMKAVIMEPLFGDSAIDGTWTGKILYGLSDTHDSSQRMLAAIAYAIADAMLAEAGVPA